MTGLILVGVFFALILCNIPIAVSMGLAAIAGLFYCDMPVSVVPSLMASAIGKSSLLAIPFFILAGVIMDYAGISRRLVNFARACIGHVRGGLAIVVVVVACFFAAISGSGPATVAALGGVLIPAMTDAGYKKGFSCGLLAASGGIGVIIPPSIAFVVYAMIAEVSVGTMFMSGILPGLLVGAAYIVASLWCLCDEKDIVLLEKVSGGERWKAFKDAFWGLLTPVIILGGIYGGIFTPTEAAGIAVVYGLFVGVFIYKEIKISSLRSLCVDSAVSSAVVMYILASAGIFTYILTTSRVAASMTEGLLFISNNKLILLLIMNVIFLIAGCFVDTVSAFYLFLPILLPIIHAMDYSPYAFGVLMTANFAVGMITPPVGVNLYVACNIGKISMTEICRHILPFVVAGVVAVLIMTYFPIISTGLPSLMGLI